MIPKVSIIIPCYNDADFIEQSVRSALNQTFQNKEVIVIDDGSDERTKEQLKKISSEVDLLITQENKGVVAARNTAIDLAKGDLILTLDSDDYFEPTFLEKGVEILNENPTVGMVSSWISIQNESGEEIRIQKPSGSVPSTALFFNNAPGSLLYRKICWNEVNGYDPKMDKGNEDWEFNIAVGKKGWKIFVIPEVLFFYRQRTISRNMRAKDFQFEIRQYAFKKHKDLLMANMDSTIDFFLEEIRKQKDEKKKITSSLSYKVGEVILEPLRTLRRIFIK